jgi:hypothetical protein
MSTGWLGLSPFWHHLQGQLLLVLMSTLPLHAMEWYRYLSGLFSATWVIHVRRCQHSA